MLNTRALTTLAEILADGQSTAHVRFLDEVGGLRPRFSDLRCPCTIRTLLYRWADLRPHIREGLDAELHQRWHEFKSIDQDGAVSAPVMVAQLSPVSTPPQKSADFGQQVVCKPGVERREDGFDRFLGWLACLLGR